MVAVEVVNLQAAAQIVRERAQAATPGPWRNTGGRYAALVADRPHPDRPTPDKGGWSYDDAYGGCLVGESLMTKDREYLALMNPTVGLAVADWLDAIAHNVGGRTRESAVLYIDGFEAAERLAELILAGAE